MTRRALDVEKLLTARLHAAKVRPYLAGALFALHVVEDRSVPTMAVDAYWRCYVSPGFVLQTLLTSWRVSGCTRSRTCSGITTGVASGSRASKRRTGRGTGFVSTSPPISRSTTTSMARASLGQQERLCPRCWGYLMTC